MPRKLKTYQTSQGFYDLAVAVPSMKAALEAWGSGMNLFHKGMAFESDDPKIIEATLAKPGLVLKRAVGSKGRFTEHAALPSDLPPAGPAPSPKVGRKAKPKARTKPATKLDDKAARKAALAYEKQQRKREIQQRKQEALKEKRRAKRDQATEKVEASLAKARTEHDAIIDRIDKDREAIEERAAAEERRWSKLKGRLDENLRKLR